MFTAASRFLLRRSLETTKTKFMIPTIMTSTTSTSGIRTMASLKEQFEDYGKMVFTGKIADEYLSKHGATGELLKDPTWVNHSSDTVAAAVFDWYVRWNVYIYMYILPLLVDANHFLICIIANLPLTLTSYSRSFSFLEITTIYNIYIL
jgi:hypothetical protein